MKGFVFIVLIFTTVTVGCEKSSDFTYKKPAEITYIATLPIDSVFEIRAFQYSNNPNDFVYFLFKNEQKFVDANGKYIGAFHSMFDNKEDLINHMMTKYKTTNKTEPFIWTK